MNIKLSFLVGLLSICVNLFAQPNLKVGDKAPLITAFKWFKGDPVAEFRKGQIYVVEFGATWCGPCKKAIPKLTELQKKYNNEVTVIGGFVMELNHEPPETGNPKYVQQVEKYVDRMGGEMGYSVFVDIPQRATEKDWIRAAGRSGVPHTYIVDKEGHIAWIGNSMEIAEKMINSMINGSYRLEEAVSKLKNDRETTKYDPKKLLLIDGNGGDEMDFKFRSLLTEFKGDIVAGVPEFISSEAKKIQLVGVDLRYLYRIAYADTLWPWPNGSINGQWMKWKTSYGKYWIEPILEVRDSGLFESSYNPPVNRWNYNLKVPENRASARFLQEAMQRDLKTYFGYEVSVELRKMPCWKLKATPEALKNLRTRTPGQPYRSSGNNESGGSMTNVPVEAIIMLLWSQDQRGAPFIDETGIKGEIDFEIKANLEDFESFRRGLMEIGLVLEKGEKELKVIVIRDPKKG